MERPEARVPDGRHRMTGRNSRIMYVADGDVLTMERVGRLTAR
jgi:hypothetical protein